LTILNLLLKKFSTLDGTHHVIKLVGKKAQTVALIVLMDSFILTIFSLLYLINPTTFNTALSIILSGLTFYIFWGVLLLINLVYAYLIIFKTRYFCSPW